MNESHPTAGLGGKLSAVNPQWHDEFVVLCSLFASGELSEEEWALLQVHLAYCDSCRLVFEEYQHLSGTVMPALAAAAFLEAEPKPASSSMEAAERRLLDRLGSDHAPAEFRPLPKRPWATYGGVLAACLVAAACLFTLRRTHESYTSAANTGVSALPPVAHESQTKVLAVTPSLAVDQRKLDAAQVEITHLQSELSAAQVRSQQLGSAATTAAEQLRSEQAELAKITADRDAVSQQLAAVRSDAQTLRETFTTANATATQQAARASALEAKLRDLNAAVDEKDRLLAVDKEFLSHDREIRDLIAARNLYIADIYDVAQNGQTAKPFGRIFYTKDRSLVFYGYDLDKQSGLKQSVAFQAWGSGEDKQNVSLGLFYQDETKKRWVLQFKDTKTLARLNMVFVTAEPQGGSAKPTGKPLLLAYLHVQANHP